MNVFIVAIEQDYEDRKIIGVFDSYDKALTILEFVVTTLLGSLVLEKIRDSWSADTGFKNGGYLNRWSGSYSYGYTASIEEYQLNAIRTKIDPEKFKGMEGVNG